MMPSSPSPSCPFITLPNELLALIITHLTPTTHPISHLSILVFRPYKPYYPLPYRSADPLHLSRTCRRLHILTKKQLREERKSEQSNLREAREAVARLLSYNPLSRELAVAWLKAWQVDVGEGRGAGRGESMAWASGPVERLTL